MQLNKPRISSLHYGLVAQNSIRKILRKILLPLSVLPVPPFQMKPRLLNMKVFTLQTYIHAHQ